MQGVPNGTPGAVPNLFGAGLNGFQDGNPATGTQGTELVAALFNDIVGNLLNVLTLAGVAPTPGRYQDLSDAVFALVLQHGQCQLRYVSNVALALMPMGGNGLRVAGKRYQIPAAGMAIANAGVMVSGVAASNLAASTVYLVYACDNGAGVLIPDFWPAAGGHLTDTTAGNIGVEVRDNAGALDPSRTLIGMVATDGASHFADFMTLSWFNRREKAQSTNFGSNTGTSSGTPVELSTSIRNSFLVWAGEAVPFWFDGTVVIGAGNDTAATGISFDGAAAENENSFYESFTGSTSGNAAFAGRKIGLAEGLHYATILGAFGVAGGGSPSGATWYGGTGSMVNVAVLGISVRG